MRTVEKDRKLTEFGEYFKELVYDIEDIKERLIELEKLNEGEKLKF